MEYSDEIQKLLDSIADVKKADQAISSLDEIFSRESGKEIYLIISEWITLKQQIDFNVFMRIIPLLVLLFDRLKNSSPLITQDLIELIYCVSQEYKPEQKQEISQSLQHSILDLPSFHVLLSLYIDDFTKFHSADKILPVFLGDSKIIDQTVAKTFVTLPESSRLALCRCATVYPELFKGITLERVAKTLIKSHNNPYLQNDGIKIVSMITPSEPRKFFAYVVTTGPFLPTSEAAVNAWKAALKMISSLSDTDRFYCYQAVLEKRELPEGSHSAICHQISREINQNKSGIFRSPMIHNLLPLILNPNIMTSPVGKTECVLTILNFLQLVLILDKKVHCFRIFGEEESMKNVTQRVQQVIKALQKAKNDNEKPKEKILEGLKKVNFGEKMSLKDIDSVVESTSLAIARVQFAVNEIQSILK